MRGVNKVILVGNVGKDPEIKYLASGTAVVNFQLATNERFTDKQGEKQERVEWHRIVAYGKLAEICGEYVAKGMPVYIEGKLHHRQWEDKDGQKHNITEIVAQTVNMLGGKRQEGGEEGVEHDPETGGGPEPRGDILF